MTQAFAAQYLGHRAGRWDLFLRPSLGHFDEQFARAPAPVLPRFDDVRDHLRAYLQRAVMGRAAAICQPRGSFTLVAPQPLVDRLARDAVRFRQRCDALAFLPLSNQFGSEFHWSVFLPWHRLLAWRAFQVDQIPPLRTVTHVLGLKCHPCPRSVPCIRARLQPCQRIGRKVWASAPDDAGKPQRLKPLATRCAAARLKPCPDTKPAAEFPLPCRTPEPSCPPMVSKSA